MTFINSKLSKESKEIVGITKNLTGTELENRTGEEVFYDTTLRDVKYRFRKATTKSVEVYCYTKEQNERVQLMLNYAGFNTESKFIDGYCYEIVVTKK